MKIGYARVSTRDQNLDLQIDALKNFGCEQIKGLNDEAKKKAHAALPLTTENNKKPRDDKHFIHDIAKIPGISKTTFIGVWIGQRSKEMKLLTKKYDNNYNNEITPIGVIQLLAATLKNTYDNVFTWQKS